MSAANEAVSEARQTWRRASEKGRPAPTGQEAAAEAQAREQYFQFKSSTVNELGRYIDRMRPDYKSEAR